MHILLTFTSCFTSGDAIASITRTLYITLTHSITATVSSEGERGGGVRVGSTASLVNVGGKAGGGTNKLRIVDQSVLELHARCVVEVEPINTATGPRVSDAKMESIGAATRVNDKSSSDSNS